MLNGFGFSCVFVQLLLARQTMAFRQQPTAPNQQRYNPKPTMRRTRQHALLGALILCSSSSATTRDESNSGAVRRRADAPNEEAPLGDDAAAVVSGVIDVGNGIETVVDLDVDERRSRRLQSDPSSHLLVRACSYHHHRYVFVRKRDDSAKSLIRAN